MSNSMMVPRGKPGGKPLALDMTKVYEAESRLYDVAVATPDNAPELMGYFNAAANTASKYFGWLQYEVLCAKKALDEAKADVILDKSMSEFDKVKERGIKYNEDFRAAVVAKDEQCQQAQDVLNYITAACVQLDGKIKSFVRAYNACRSVAERRGTIAATPVINGAIGSTLDGSDGFMGTSRYSGGGE